MMKPDIKLVALDMDGTLLNRAGEISEENRKAIKEAEEQGVFVVLSTGRSYATCSDFAKSMALRSYLITVNGSEIYDNQGKLVERNIVDTESVQWMWELSQKHGTHFWAISCDNVYRAEMPEKSPIPNGLNSDLIQKMKQPAKSSWMNWYQEAIWKSAIQVPRILKSMPGA